MVISLGVECVKCDWVLTCVSALKIDNACDGSLIGYLGALDCQSNKRIGWEVKGRLIHFAIGLLKWP